ncbi:cardiolipin synthase [Candidatus Saccharibacteria bacterium]|nr:cardiolipin synthase [Candidatus Saccharibacteria bacterium]
MIHAIKRLLIVLVGAVLQISFSIFIRLFFNSYIAIIGVIYELIGVIIIINILKDSRKLSRDIIWVIFILLSPLFGTILYTVFGTNLRRNKLFRSIKKAEKENKKYLVQDEKIKNEIIKSDRDDLQYIVNYSGYPVTTNSKLTYYDFGEKFYPEFLKELKKAKKFIFMEYFIINKGKMWDSILEILKEKAKAGVDVRLIYDDMGSIAMLSEKYPKELSELGIKCIAFNKMSPFKGIFMNNRDHRKITVIDGKVAFTGGVNLSDEYINEKERFGVWKDNGLKVEGEAIWNLTVMFLTLWNVNISDSEKDKDYEKFKVESTIKIHDGFVVPYGLSPLYQNSIGEDIYLNMIDSAHNYLYIMTPYLVVDSDITSSLIRAAKRGVDVKIIVPGIPDKKFVYQLTTSYFRVLHENGVKICVYDKGFVHSKVFVSDDKKAIVGTINLDYRSLYLHFENGVYFEENSEVKKVKEDCVSLIKECRELKDKDVKTSPVKRAWQMVIRLFAPLC